MFRVAWPAAILALAFFAGCSSESPSDSSTSGSSTSSGSGGSGGGAATAVEVRMDYTRKSGFYASPFPSDDRLNSDGTADISGFPEPGKPALEVSILALARKVHGFGISSGIYFQLTGAIDGKALPSMKDSIGKTSSVYLVSVDPTAKDFATRYPIDVVFAADGGPFGDTNLLEVLPLQGVPLRPNSRYAVVVKTSAGGSVKLASSSVVADMLHGKQPAGMNSEAFSHYRAALTALAKLDDPNAFAGLSVFTTGDATTLLGVVRDAMLALPTPQVNAPFTPNEVFPDYCVFSTTIDMPDYQGGTPPYTTKGGAWVFDAAGKPVLQSNEKANFVATVPRQAMPANGFPMVVFSRTGGGGDRPLVDRGVQAMTNGPPITPGTGPAMYFAMAGWAGASIDGPLGGLRNPTGDPSQEDFTIFNVANPPALLDNIRQSAVELMLAAHILANLSFDASSCPDFSAPGGLVKFDGSTMALMGHSMGATISPLSLAGEPMFRAGILSGAGGSWINNVIYKQSPLVVKSIAEVLLDLHPQMYVLDTHDPLLTMLQWAGEAADPPIYARAIVSEPNSGSPRHVLMEQGIVDTYITPSIADSTSLSIGLDLAGKELDQNNATLEKLDQAPLGPLLGYVGRKAISLPVQSNIGKGSSAVTAIIVQHPQDDVEDGHEIVFQTDPPKREYLCFLRSLAATGTPRVPDDNGPVGSCD